MDSDRFYKSPHTGTVKTGADWNADLMANFSIPTNPLAIVKNASFLDAALVEVKYVKGRWIDQR